jgi:dTDP-4-dehydrorhamnose reductase
MSTVSILGSTGMLGHSVVQEFAGFAGTLIGSSKRVETNSLLHQSFFLDATVRELPEALHKLGPTDYVINCIGVIKPYILEDSAASRERALLINGVFPYALDALADDLGFKIIQIATDCVFSGKKGFYTEADQTDADDLYGKSKALGEVLYGNTLTIRTSTIGYELNTKYGLLNWFLSQENTCKG